MLYDSQVDEIVSYFGVFDVKIKKFHILFHSYETVSYILIYSYEIFHFYVKNTET